MTMAARLTRGGMEDWDLSDPEPVEMIQQRHERVRQAFAPDPPAVDARDVEMDRTERDHRDPDDEGDGSVRTEEEKRVRNLANSRAGQQRKQLQDNLRMMGMDLDEQGNPKIVNTALHRGYLEAQGLLQQPPMPSAADQKAAEEAAARQQREAQAAKEPELPEVPAIEDPNDPMPDPYETAEFAAWQSRHTSRVIAHTQAQVQRQMMQEMHQMRQQFGEQVGQVQQALGGFTDPMQQVQARTALAVARQELSQQPGMEALLENPDFEENFGEVLRQSKLDMKNWSRPETVRMMAGILLGSDPALMESVVERAVQQRLQNQEENPDNLTEQGDFRDVPRQSQAQQRQRPPQSPRNPASAYQPRDQYAEFGTTNGRQRSTGVPARDPQIEETARALGWTYERALAAQDPNGVALAQYDREQQRRQRSGTQA